MPRGVLRHDEVLAGDAVLELPILTRVRGIEWRANNGDRPATRIHCGLMRRRVHAGREAAYDNHVMPDENPCKLHGSADPIVGRPTCSNN